jgi:hypothetical protein
MNNIRIFKLGSGAFIFLGIMHILTQLAGKPLDPDLDLVLLAMQNYKIQLLGDHSLLEFYTGFSLIMGSLLSAYGVQNFVLAQEIVANKKIFISIIISTLFILVLAILFIHILAYGFILFSLFCFLIAYQKSKF